MKYWYVDYRSEVASFFAVYWYQFRSGPKILVPESYCSDNTVTSVDAKNSSKGIARTWFDYLII